MPWDNLPTTNGWKELPPAENKDVRAGRGIHGEVVILAAWCSVCAGESLPTDEGLCLHCGHPIVNEESLRLSELTFV